MDAMLRLAKSGTTPPGGYRYIDKDTEQSFEAPSMRTLVKKVTQHRAANKLEIPEDLSVIIEDWLCRHLPPGLCKDSAGRLAKKGSHYRTAESSLHETSSLNRAMRSAGRFPASIEVANARAAICVSCEFNLAMVGCMSCRGVEDIINSMRHGQKSSYDLQLRVCGICGVLNHIHVFIDDKTIVEKAGSIKDYPENCWKRKLVKGARSDASKHRTERVERGSSNQGSSKAQLQTRRQGVARNRSRPRRVKGGCCGRSRK